MRTGFVLTTIALALGLGIIGGISESRPLTRALIIGFAPAIWAALHVIERLTGRDMWHFTAPWWVRESSEVASTPSSALGKPVENMVESDAHSTLPLAA
jgi:hypothetical protein